MDFKLNIRFFCLLLFFVLQFTNIEATTMTMEKAFTKYKQYARSLNGSCYNELYGRLPLHRINKYCKCKSEAYLTAIDELMKTKEYNKSQKITQEQYNIILDNLHWSAADQLFNVCLPMFDETPNNFNLELDKD